MSTNKTIKVYEVAAYADLSGRTVYREYGKAPNGKEFNGAWVYRINGEYVDHNTYRHDLMELYNMESS